MSGIGRLVLVSLLVAGAGAASQPALGDDAPRVQRLTLHETPEPVSITPFHFGANCEYDRPGLFYGTLPESDLRSKREEFAAAIRRTCRSLRFPGGNCSYWYLYDSEEATRALTSALKLGRYAPGSFPNQHFTHLAGFLAFCRERDIEPIVQLPTMFYNDAGQPRTVQPSKYSERAPELYDRDRLEEATAYVRTLVETTRSQGFDVKHWELGNEEFAHYDLESYARLVAAFGEAVREVSPKAELSAPMMHWAGDFVPKLKAMGYTPETMALTTHYPFANWYLMPKDVDITDPLNYVMADMAFGKNLRGSQESLAEYGWPDAHIAVTETSTIRFPQKGEHSWDPFAVIPSFGHGLAFAYNWSVLISQPACSTATFHDLESTYFGLMKYDVYYDRENKRFAWIPPDWTERPDTVPEECWFEDEYVVSPTALAMGMLAELTGCRLLGIDVDEPGSDYARHRLHAVAGWSEEGATIVAVNRMEEPHSLEISVPPAWRPAKDWRCRALTAEHPRSVLPHEFHETALPVKAPLPTVELPPYSIVLLEGTGAGD
jgi:hypothetical protein